MRFHLFVHLRGSLISPFEWVLLLFSFGAAWGKEVVAESVACCGGFFDCLGFVVNTHVGNTQSLFVRTLLAKLALVWFGDLLVTGWLIWHDALLSVVSLTLLIPTKALGLVEMLDWDCCWNVLVASKGWSISYRIYWLLQNWPLHLLCPHSHVNITLSFWALKFAAIILTFGFLVKVSQAHPLAFPVLGWRGSGRDLKSLKCVDKACV